MAPGKKGGFYKVAKANPQSKAAKQQSSTSFRPWMQRSVPCLFGKSIFPRSSKYKRPHLPGSTNCKRLQAMASDLLKGNRKPLQRIESPFSATAEFERFELLNRARPPATAPGGPVSAASASCRSSCQTCKHGRHGGIFFKAALGSSF